MSRSGCGWRVMPRRVRCSGCEEPLARLGCGPVRLRVRAVIGGRRGSGTSRRYLSSGRVSRGWRCWRRGAGWLGPGLSQNARNRVVARFITKEGGGLDAAYKQLLGVSPATTAWSSRATPLTVAQAKTRPAKWEERGADAVRVSVSSNGVQLSVASRVDQDEALTENDGGSAGSVVVHTHSRVSSAGAGLKGGKVYVASGQDSPGQARALGRDGAVRGLLDGGGAPGG